MKKFLSFALILAMLTGMTACTDKQGDDTTDMDTTENTPVETEWGDFKLNESDPKTIAEQRKEIKDAMTLAMNTDVVWQEEPDFSPINPKYAHIKAITYDGLTLKGQKTKNFAYIGFPAGASWENPVPAVVLIHGGEGHPFLDWVNTWNEHGYAAIAMETTGYFPEDRERLISSAKYIQGLHGPFIEEGYVSTPDRFYTTEYMEVEEQWAYHGISQVILASNILRQDERVIKDQIGITGISWGGTMTAQVIGYDNRYAFAIPVYGTAYLGDETRPFQLFGDKYVDALWASERNLDNATMPTLWFAYDDDMHFGVPAYCKSYLHTAEFNEKNALLMINDWGHGHSTAWNRIENYLFADWVLGRGDGLITFETQPEGREINCKLNIPKTITGDVTATLCYIDAPMSYSEFNKHNAGVKMYLDQYWQFAEDCLTVDTEAGTLTGTIPEDARGYYINVSFNVGETPCRSSSIYVAVE